MSTRNRSLGLILSCGVLFAPVVSYAQDDDDMPDGDVDIREEKKKPGKPAPPKKDPPKKTEPSAEPKKVEPKKDPPPPKKVEPKAAPSDEEDLTGDNKPATPARAPDANDVLVDDDDMPGVEPTPVRSPVREAPKVITLPTRRLDDDEPPRREVVNPARAPDPEPDDAEVTRTNPTPARSLDEPAKQDEESEGPPGALIVGGAIGGAVIVLAGAGIGGYFLFSSLASGGTTSVTIVPN